MARKNPFREAIRVLMESPFYWKMTDIGERWIPLPERKELVYALVYDNMLIHQYFHRVPHNERPFIHNIHKNSNKY